MYHEGEAVALPAKGSRVLQRTKRCTYVYYFTERRYDAARGRTVDDRVAVGKLCPDGETMWPNDRWLEILAASAEEGERRVAKYRNVGVYLALRAAAEATGALGALKGSLPGQWDRLLAVATYVVDDGSADAQGFPYWCYHNYCGFAVPFSDSTVSELYSEVYEDDWGRDAFYESFREAYLRAVPRDGDGPVAVALDGTNHLCRSKGNAYRGHGRPKAGKSGVAQVNTALVVDEMTGIPMYTEEFCGSILDMTETPQTVERMRTLGFEKLLFAVDSGYASADCASAFSDAGFEFTVMAPAGYALYRDAMAGHSQEVRRESHYIAGADCYGTAIRGVGCLGGTYDVHLFFDASRAKEEVDSIHSKAQALLALANSRVRYTDKFAARFAPHVVVTKAPRDPDTGRTYRAEIDAEVIQAEIDDAGYFCVVASPGHDSAFVLRTQRMRDRAEKEFRRYNTAFGMLGSGTHWTRTHVGKSFMGFLALVASESLRWECRSAMTGSATLQTLLGELRKLQCFKGSKGTGELATGMTRRQKEIFACLGMDEAAVRAQVRGLSL